MFFNCTIDKTSELPAPLARAPVADERFAFPAIPHTRDAADFAHNTNWRQARDVDADAHGKRLQGRVKWYDQSKKYGFIISNENREYFVHRDDLKPRNSMPDPHLFTGEYVEYETIPTMDGRLKAANVSGIQHGPLMCDHGKAPVRLINLVDSSKR
jgi:cold shock CspA family protein